MAVGKKIILITGSNTGIGLETAIALARDHPEHHIIMSARSVENGTKALAEIRSKEPKGSLSFLQLDISSDDSIATATEQITADFGKLDVLINNAGIAGETATTRDEMIRLFNTNVFGTMLLTTALVPLLQKSTDPRIINVTSGLGSIACRLNPSSSDYSVPSPIYRMTKSALNMLTANLIFMYRDWEHKPKVWSYCPGWVATNLGGNGKNLKDMRKELGAGDPETSAQGILEAVMGERDGEMDQVITKYGKTLPW